MVVVVRRARVYRLRALVAPKTDLRDCQVPIHREDHTRNVPEVNTALCYPPGSKFFARCRQSNASSSKRNKSIYGPKGPYSYRVQVDAISVVLPLDDIYTKYIYVGASAPSKA